MKSLFLFIFMFNECYSWSGLGWYDGIVVYLSIEIWRCLKINPLEPTLRYFSETASMCVKSRDFKLYNSF